MSNHGIWIVERSRLFRQGLAMLMRETPFEVTFEAPQMSDVDTVEARDRPAIILVNIETELPADSEEAQHLARLCAMQGNLPVVVLSDGFSLAQLVAVMRAGASGYILKDIAPEALVQSLNLILAGEKVLPTNLVPALLEGRDTRFLQDETRSSGAALSSQEEHILRGLAQGYPNKRIAMELAISESMVKLQVKKIFNKIRARNRTEAAIWARQNFRRSA